jgi:hypothetical protein
MTTATTTIEIIVSPQGETSIQTKGFRGSVCRQASRDIERALGQPIEERLTTEFHQQPVQQQAQHQGN